MIREILMIPTSLSSKKACKRCGVYQPMESFYKHNGMADGHLNFCKPCVKKRVSGRWYNNAETHREQERLRYRKRRNNPEFVKRAKDYQREYRTPEISRAHNEVYRKLTKPPKCELCGVKCKPEAHHPDYTEPLRVIWLCSPCHKQLHKRLRVA